MAIVVISIVGVVLLDQFTKYMVTHLFYLGESIPVIPNIFHLTYVRNTGVAFGLFRNVPYLACVLVLISCVLVVVIMKHIKGMTQINKIACAMILGGAVGNIIDRVRVGAVIDFIDLRIWPVFNVADSFISVAAGLLIISMMRKVE